MDKEFIKVIKNLPEKEKPISVRLQLNPDTIAFFKKAGKGHITRMQNILEAYAKYESENG